MKYSFIDRYRHCWPVSVQCRVLQVSAAGYHAHLVRRASDAQRRHLSHEALRVHIKAVVIDLFSRRVVGWSLRKNMSSSIVIDALRMAWFKRHPGKHAGLMFHSHRGSQ